MEYRFGDFTLDTTLGRLTGPHGDCVLRRQSWRLLLELVEQAPALVGRDELLDRVWGRSALSPNALPQTISELRQVLGDSAREPRYIETCHGRGYRLICPVERTTAKSSAEPVAAASAPWGGAVSARPHSRWPWAWVAVTAILLLSAGLVYGPGNRPVGNSVNQAGASIESLKRQAEVALARNDPASAAAHLRALTLLEPHDPEWPLAQAAAELDALQGANARRSLALLAAQPALHQDPRLLILQSRLAMIDGDMPLAVDLAEAARLQAHSLGLSEQVTKATQWLARAHERQGQLDLAAAALLTTLDDPDLEFAGAERFALTLELATLRRNQGRLDDARAAFERAELMRVDASSEFRLAVEQALLKAADGEPDLAWQSLQRLYSQSPQGMSPEQTLKLFSALGQVAVEIGEIDQALAAYEQAFALARATGQAYQVAGMQINTGSLMARRDRFEEAERLWEAALETFERIGDRRGEGIALGNLAAAASAQGHNTRSESLNRRALEVFRQLDLDGPRARTAFNLALVASREGRLDEAESLLAEAQAGYEHTGNIELALHVGAVRVDHRVLAGDLLAAEALLNALEQIAETASSLRRAGLLASRGRLEKWRGNLNDARGAFEQALALRIDSGQAGWVATSELELQQLVLLEGGDPWRVRVKAGELAKRFEQSGQSRAAARARLLAAEALLSEGDLYEARAELDLIRQHHSTFNDFALQLDLAWVEAWAARKEERQARFESLAERALQHGYLGKVAQIEAGLLLAGLDLEPLAPITDRQPATGQLVAPLPSYAAGAR